MDLFWHQFAVSGVETYLFIPPLVMLAVSSLTSTAGVSGAFILLPFQMSVLGYTAPGVTATNFVYNIVAIPFGVFQYIRHKRLSWHLFFTLTAGTMPGLFFGYYMRITVLPDPQKFKFFAGLVLAFLVFRTIQNILADLRRNSSVNRNTKTQIAALTGGKFGLRRTKIYCGDQNYAFSTPLLLLVSMFVGVVGGSYGIGGGAILAPFCISVLNLPVALVSGAALFSTWTSSVVAALFYAFLPLSKSGLNTAPDWTLGSLFGLGGMLGIYMGTFLQKRFPAVWIKIILATCILVISIRYMSTPLLRFLR